MYWVKDPTAYERDDFFIYIGHKPIIDYLYKCLFVLAGEPEAQG